jgi:predicted metal-dependent hydrolase
VSGPPRHGVARRIRTANGWLHYRLRRGSTKHLAISVEPDLSISVVAPRHADAREVDRRVLRRLHWIIRQQRHFERFHPLPVPRRYVSGETHLYLGRQYRLRIRSGPERVGLAGAFLRVTLEGRRSSGRVERLVKRWYRERAAQVIPRRLALILRRSPWLGASEPPIRLREMTRRWGSCGPGRVVTLNLDLMKAPVSCLDYILTHELCHRIELRHSRRFYALLRRAMPEWERASTRLNVFVR